MANNKPFTQEELVEAEEDNIYLYFLAEKLREKWDVYIEVLYDYEYDSTPYHYYIRHLGVSEGRDYKEWKNDYSTYEEALLAGIKDFNDNFGND